MGHLSPDNSRLLHFIDIYWKADGKGGTYENVVSELMNGNSFLMLPGENEINTGSREWITTSEAKTIKLSSVYKLDGLKVLAAFTDEKALLDWAKKACSYTSMRSQDVLKLCEENGIARVVINNNSSNMFVLEKSRKDTKEYVIKESTKVALGIPATPLNRYILDKMVSRFTALDSISKVYHYGQMKGKDFSLVLGFELKRRSENEKTAVIDLVRDVIANEELPHPWIFFSSRRRNGEVKLWRLKIA